MCKKKKKNGEKAKLCFMNTESFVVYIKTEGNYVDVLKDIETIFDTSKYTSDRLIPEGKKRS